MSESRLEIPFPSSQHPTSQLVGILRCQHGSATGVAKRIALILHGVLAHKNQLYHRKLAENLEVDSFRFDFRANDESPGEWGMGDFEKDVEDLHVVIKYLREELNYHVESIIGHSRGTLVGWSYFSDVMQRRKGAIANKERFILDSIPYWVALSGRWRMHRIHDRDDMYEPAFAEKGYYSWDVKVAGRKVSVQVRRKDVDKFASYDIEGKVSNFPQDMDCFIIQGAADPTVPAADAGYYLNKLNEKQRRPQSAQLLLIDDADHNFRGQFDHVVHVICQWLHRRKQDGSADAARELDNRIAGGPSSAKGRL